MSPKSKGVQAVFLISGWGERIPLMFKVEPEFGLEGYLGILAEELRELEHMIVDQGLGKGGEEYVRSIPPSPAVQLCHSSALVGSEVVPATPWQLRYAVRLGDDLRMKKGIIPKLLGRLASSRKFYTLVRLASRVGLRPGPWFCLLYTSPSPRDS